MKNFSGLAKQNSSTESNDDEPSEPATGCANTRTEIELYHLKRAKVIALANNNYGFVL